MYGPSTVLVLTLGAGVHVFTLDREVGSFVLTQESLAIPPDTKEFSINMSNARFREPPVKRYVEELVAGRDGPRGKDFNMRWVASMVADVFRILARGGIFLYPRDTRDPAKPRGRAGVPPPARARDPRFPQRGRAGDGLPRLMRM